MVRRTEAYPMTLGALIAALEQQPQTQAVRFAFGDFCPRAVDSYRGFYDQLALGYDDGWQHETTVGELLATLKAAVGETFTGYKGGEFTMDADTPVWAANRGKATQCGIVGVTNAGYMVVLETAFCSW